MSVPASARHLVDMAEALGFAFEGHDGKGHLRFTHSNGAHVSLPSTPGEYRGRLNAQLQLERAAGTKLPRVNKRRSHKACKPSGFSIEAAHREQQQWHGVHDTEAQPLLDEHAALVARCRQLATRRHTLRAIPPLLERIAAIETRLLALHHPVERFDPYSLQGA